MFLIMWNNNIVIIFQGNWPAEKTCAIKLPVTNKKLMKLGNSAVWKTAFKIMWFQDRKHSVLAVNVLSCDMSEDTARRPSHAVVPNLLMFFSKCDIHSSCSPTAPAPPHTIPPPPPSPAPAPSSQQLSFQRGLWGGYLWHWKVSFQSCVQISMQAGLWKTEFV